MFFGFFLVQTNLIEKLRNIEVIGWTTLIFGILLYLSDRYKLKKIFHIILIINQQFL